MTRYTPLWEQAGSYAASVDRRLINAIWPTAGVSGCAVTVVASSMNMNIAAGTVTAPAANNTGSVLCYSDAVEIVTSPAAPAGGTNRYDVVVCQPRGNDLDGGANNDFIFTVVSGTASATPAVPAVPAGAVPLAQILVIGGAATLASGNLTDRRIPLSPSDALHARVYRTAGFTVGTTPAIVPFDTVANDPWHMYSTGTSSFVVPVTGVYLATARVVVATTGAGQFITDELRANGASHSGGGVNEVTNPSFSEAVVAATSRFTAGDALSIYAAASVSLAGSGGSSASFFSLDYLGTG